MTITYDDWIKQTAKTGKTRSKELKAVDKAFSAWEKAPTGQKKTDAMQELARVFRIWLDLKSGPSKAGSSAPTGGVALPGLPVVTTIRNRKKVDGEGPVDRLQALIQTHKSTNRGIVQDLHGTIPPGVEMEASLRGDAKNKIEEAYRRCKSAVSAAQDWLISANSPGQERDAFVRWFGAFDGKRLGEAKRNVARLHVLFSSGRVNMKDGRTHPDPNWRRCFGWATPGTDNLNVEFFVGEGFFAKVERPLPQPGETEAQKENRLKKLQKNIREGGFNLADWTVGTMIHELSHAANGLPDVNVNEPIQASGNSFWIPTGGLPPSGSVQCSTPELGQLLAQEKPEFAIKNADNYGQFCREAMQAKGQ